MSFYKPAHNTDKRKKVYEEAKECQAEFDKLQVKTVGCDLTPQEEADWVGRRKIMQYCVDYATESVKDAYRTTTHRIPWLWILGILVSLITAWNMYF